MVDRAWYTSCVRRALLATVLAGTLASCGLASGSPDGPPAGTPAGPTLQAIVAPAGPTRTRLTATLTIDGAPSSLGVAGALLASPIPIVVDLTRDPASGAVDGSVTVTAGGLDIPLRLLATANRSWVRYGADWYVADRSSVSALLASATGSAVPDLAALAPDHVLAFLTDPRHLQKGAVVAGSGDVAGIASSHVAGKVDGVELLAAVGRLLGAAGTLSAVQNSELAASIRTNALDVWVGTADHEVHRATLNLIANTEGVGALQGTRRISLVVDVTISPADPPVVVAPTSPRPLSALVQAALGSLAPALLGGGTP